MKLFPPKAVIDVLEIQRVRYSQWTRRHKEFIKPTQPATGQGTVAKHSLVNICQYMFFKDISEGGVPNGEASNFAFSKRAEIAFEVIIKLETVKNWLRSDLRKAVDDYYEEFHTHRPQTTPYSSVFFIRDKNGDWHAEYFDDPHTYVDLLPVILKYRKAIHINLTDIALTVLARLINDGHLDKP